VVQEEGASAARTARRPARPVRALCPEMGLHGVAACSTKFYMGYSLQHYDRRCAPLRQALPVEWPLQTEARHIFGKDRILGPGFVPQAAPLRCSRTIKHPVYLVARNDEWNPFHATEVLPLPLTPTLTPTPTRTPTPTLTLSLTPTPTPTSP